MNIHLKDGRNLFLNFREKAPLKATPTLFQDADGNVFVAWRVLDDREGKRMREAGYRLGDDIQSKVLAFAFGLSAEIERNLISQRTKEALERKKAEGQKLGRPLGTENASSKLDGAELGTTIMLLQGISINRIANLYGVHRKTVQKFISKRRLDSSENITRTLQLLG